MKFQYKISWGQDHCACIYLNSGQDLDREVRYLLGDNAGGVSEDPETIRIEILVMG